MSEHRLQRCRVAYEEVRPYRGSAWQAIPVRDANLTVRAYNCLTIGAPDLGMAALTLGDLDRLSDRQLLKVKNLGRVTLLDIRETIRDAQHGTDARQADVMARDPGREHLVSSRVAPYAGGTYRCERCGAWFTFGARAICR